MACHSCVLSVIDRIQTPVSGSPLRYPPQRGTRERQAKPTMDIGLRGGHGTTRGRPLSSTLLGGRHPRFVTTRRMSLLNEKRMSPGEDQLQNTSGSSSRSALADFSSSTSVRDRRGKLGNGTGKSLYSRTQISLSNAVIWRLNPVCRRNQTRLGLAPDQTGSLRRVAPYRRNTKARVTEIKGVKNTRARGRNDKGLHSTSAWRFVG